jgi:hypothetical protein
MSDQAWTGRQKDNSLRSTSSSPGRPPFPKLSPSKGSSHSSVNGFNRREIEQHLTTSKSISFTLWKRQAKWLGERLTHSFKIEYQAVMNAHHDLSNSEREKPEKYSSGEAAWGSKSATLGDNKGKVKFWI